MELGGSVFRLTTTVALNLFDAVLIDTANVTQVTKSAVAGVLMGICVGYCDGKYPGSLAHMFVMNAAGTGVGPAAGAVAIIQIDGIAVGVADTAGVTVGQHVIQGAATAGRLQSTAAPTAGSVLGRALSTATAGNQFFFIMESA
jgi:hypothetical protein